MVKDLLYVGSYSSENGDGIYICRFDEASGNVHQAFPAVKAPNPSYLRFSGGNLYAVLETAEFEGIPGGGAASYALRKDGRLTLINTLSSGGAGPCHLCINRRQAKLYTANYSDGSFSVLNLGTDGALLPRASVVRHRGHGTDTVRQEGPHIHFTELTPDGRHLCTADLGLDRVIFYRLSPDGIPCEEDAALSLPLAPGSGPRHALFGGCGNVLYILTELSGQLLVFRQTGEGYAQVQCLPTTPEDFQDQNYPSALRFSPDGRFICASNRGHDSLAVYRVRPDGTLAPCGIYPSGGKWPRDFAFSSDGNYVFAANERSNEITVLHFDAENGSLQRTDMSQKLYRPTCIQVLKGGGI